ncbi:MAG TPA: hypothetical protein VGL68_03735 [Solirubrobacteraceae bacterium]|jgi:hypothetical protein
MADAGGGPYVQTAVICETFIRGAETGRLTIINLIEGATVVGTDPDQMDPFTIGPPLKLIIGLWAGRSQGRYNIQLRPEAPSGLQGDPIQLPPVNFSGPGATGIDVIVPMPEYEVTEEGTYWFDVLFYPGGGEEPRVLTRIPFSVTYQPQVSFRPN